MIEDIITTIKEEETVIDISSGKGIVDLYIRNISKETVHIKCCGVITDSLPPGGHVFHKNYPAKNDEPV